MRLLYVNHWYDPEMASLEDLLETYSTMAGWVEAIHGAGIDVSVVQRFHRNDECIRGGVRFVLVKDQHPPHLRQWQMPRSLTRAIQKSCAESRSKNEPTVMHFNGLHFPFHLRAVRAALPRQSAIAVQHHAERPWRGLRRRVQVWGLRAADGFFFSAAELATSWIKGKLISPHQAIYQIMEGSTNFRRQDRDAARARTAMTGDPVVLWVGRLIAIKDPLAVLKGFQLALQHMPNARLYMVYGSADLLPEVRASIAESPLLSASVTLCGSLPHATLESVYNSADYFVLGSHYEGSGYSLAEALACGVVPVVTDIASFRAMTDGGKVGAFWQPGDSEAFAASFLQVAAQPVRNLSDEAVHIFEKHLSFRSIARKAISAYRDMAARRAEQRS